MLAVDDLRPIGKVFGEPEAKVPTLDKLASESVVFENAWVQCATCGYDFPRRVLHFRGMLLLHAPP